MAATGMHRFPFVIERAEGNYSVYSPDLPYHPAYFIKNTKTIIEPLAHPIQAVDWTKIAMVFQELYDLKNKTEMDYHFYAILDDEDNEWPDEPKLLLSDVAKILLWSRRRQWKDKILKEAA